MTSLRPGGMVQLPWSRGESPSLHGRHYEPNIETPGP